MSITIAPSVVATTTTLVSSASQLTQGQTFTLSATVIPANATAAAAQGNVNFYLGQTQLGSAALSGGQATWTGAASFAPGIYPVTAVYSGNAQDSGSTSTAISITIAAPVVTPPPPQTFSTTTVLTINAAQVTAGQNITLAVKVAEQGGTATPAGTIAFTWDRPR